MLGDANINTVSFMGIEPQYTELDKSRFVVLPVPYEQTTSYKKGTRFGPGALIDASCQVELMDEELMQDTYKVGIHTLPPFPINKDPAVFIRELSDYTQHFLDKGKFVVTLGGEHTVTAGTIIPYAKKYPKLSVFHIDAHPDLRNEYEGSIYNHACALRRVLDYAPIVQVGIRCITPEEVEIINSGRVKTFFAHSYKSVKEIIPSVLKTLSDDVYITIDLDGLDPSIMPGVGTPVPGGLMWYETLEILREIIYKKNVVGADVMELCPLQDNVLSEFTAAKLTYKIMGYVVKSGETRANKRGDKVARKVRSAVRK